MIFNHTQRYDDYRSPVPGLDRLILRDYYKALRILGSPKAADVLEDNTYVWWVFRRAEVGFDQEFRVTFAEDNTYTMELRLSRPKQSNFTIEVVDGKADERDAGVSGGGSDQGVPE